MPNEPIGICQDCETETCDECLIHFAAHKQVVTTFTDYQKLAHTTAVYPRYPDIAADLQYSVLGLTNEAGEVAGKLKKLLRGDRAMNIHDFKHNLGKELGDVLWYLSEICTVLGIDFVSVAQRNLVKLSERMKSGTIKGDGDDR